MDIDRACDFVRTHHRAVLATRTPDGGIQQTPVLAVVDDAGRIVVSSRETAYKTKFLRTDPWAQLCVFKDTFFGRWVFVEGRADIVSLPEAMTALEDYYRRAVGEHPDWDDYREAMVREQRVVIRVEPLRAGPDRRG